MRFKLSFQDVILIILKHINTVSPDIGVPWVLNPSIKTCNWYTIYEQIKIHWEKFWPIKKKESFLESGRYPPLQLSSAITTLSAGNKPLLMNMHKEFLFYQNQDNQSMINDPSGCQYQGYYALNTSSLPISIDQQEAIQPSYYVSSKNGELVLINNSVADNPKKLRDIILTNMDFERPNPNMDSVKICKAASHTHPYIKISDDGKSISHSRGYRTAKATHGMFEGDWYYEIVLKEGHARVGWGHSLSDIHAPIGYDEYGYGYGDVTGNVFHTGRFMAYSEPWNIGDVIGCRIVLPPISDKDSKLFEDLQREYESKYPPLRAGNYKIRMSLHPGSFIAFYKNGRYLGKSFGPIYRGKYYPSFSVYKGVIDVHFSSDDLQYYHSVTKGEENMQICSIPKPCNDMCVTKENFDYGIHSSANDTVMFDNNSQDTLHMI